MKAAFDKAGYPGREEWPTDELLQVAINAMIRHADDTDACQNAIMRACRNDTALLRSLLAPWWRQATSSLIQEARRELRRRARDGEANAREKRAAKVLDLQHERERARENREREAALAEQGRLDRDYRDVYLKQWTQTKARDFRIDDQPFWEVSTRDARVWQRRHAHRATFLDLVLSGVPEDDRPIGHYRRPDEIDVLWDRAFH